MDWVLPVCGDLYPSNEPPEVDSELKEGGLRNHLLLWPKTLIRLNATSGSAASQGKVTPPVASADDPPEPTTQHHSEDPLDECIVDLNMDQPPHDSPYHCEDLPTGKYECLKKKLFNSQETPEEAAAFTAPEQCLVSPMTLRDVTVKAMRAGGTPACLKRKQHRKRHVKKDASASQPTPRVLDRLPIEWRQFH
jgi:hypothetical protein